MNRKKSTIFSKPDRYSTNKSTSSSSTQPTIFQLGGVIVLQEFNDAKSVLVKYQDLNKFLVKPENAISDNSKNVISINTLQKFNE